jgi:hypothetical protein
MKPIVKNLIIIATFVAGGLAYYGYKKLLQIKAIFSVMEILPVGFSNFDFNLKSGKIRMNIDVKLINHSKDDLFVTGAGFAVLKKIVILYKGVYLGEGEVNINSIHLPAENVLVIKNTPIEGSAMNLLANAKNLMNFNLDDVTIIGTIEAMGKQYEISNA